MEVLTIVSSLIAAVIGATLGIWLDRHFQQIDLRRSVYQQWLQFSDDIWSDIREALHAGREETEVQVDIDRRLNAAMAQVELLASTEVLEAVKKYQVSWSRAINDALQAIRRDGTPPDVVIPGNRNALVADRSELISTFRNDIAQKAWSRRKVAGAIAGRVF